MGAKTKKRSLTAKQQRFCEEYMIDLNATQAAIRAGYAKSCVNVIGPNNIVKSSIKAEITRLKAKISKKTGVTVKWVIDNLIKVAERCIDDNDAPGANRALQLIGMHVGAFEADNKQKQPDQRSYTLIELRGLLDADKAKTEAIMDISEGIAE